MSEEHKADVEAYIRGVTNGTIVTGRLNRLAVWRHLEDIEKWKTDETYEFKFDEQIALDAIEFSLCCNQFEGEWADKQLALRPEQKFIVWCLFGWRQKSDGLRRFRQAQIECARKWGKSTFTAYLCCLLLFADCPPEPGAQGYVAATKKKQAQIVWDAAAEMIRKSPELAAEAIIKPSLHEISLPDMNSWFYPLAQDGDTVDGFNPHFIIKDEEHAYRKFMARFINTLSSGFGARRQPLTITITTYGDDTSDIWQGSHDYAVKVLESVITGQVVDDRWFVFIAAVDREKDCPCFRCKGASCPWCGGSGELPVDEPYNETCWIKANPGLGLTPKLERMRESANEARQRPDKESEFLQKNLNIVVSAKEKFIQAEQWGPGGELSDRTTAPGHGGFDLGRVNDFAAIAGCWGFEETDDSGEQFKRYEIESKSYTVAERVGDMKTAQLARWIQQGFLEEHSGDQVDFTVIRDDILEWHNKYVLRTWAYDATFAMQMAQEIMAEGVDVFKFTQAPKYYTEPVREFRKLVGKSRTVGGKKVSLLKHNGCPVLAWQAGNLMIDRNARGESMPDKRQQDKKIDAMVAVLMAFSECLYHKDETTSVYQRENRGFIEIG